MPDMIDNALEECRQLQDKIKPEERAAHENLRVDFQSRVSTLINNAVPSSDFFRGMYAGMMCYVAIQHGSVVQQGLHPEDAEVFRGQLMALSSVVGLLIAESRDAFQQAEDFQKMFGNLPEASNGAA